MEYSYGTGYYPTPEEAWQLAQKEYWYDKEQRAEQSAWEKQFAATNVEYENRYNSQIADATRQWEAQFAAENAQWEEQAGITQQLDEETWNEQFAAQNEEWWKRYMTEQGATTTTTSEQIVPAGPRPVAWDPGSFAAPVRDEARIQELTQQKSSAGLRDLRGIVQKATTQKTGNENVDRMTLREALAGYGQGIESVITGAQTSANAEYEGEYDTAYDAASMSYAATNAAKAQAYQAAVEDYFKQYGTKTTTTKTY